MAGRLIYSPQFGYFILMFHSQQGESFHRLIISNTRPNALKPGLFIRRKMDPAIRRNMSALISPRMSRWEDSDDCVLSNLVPRGWCSFLWKKTWTTLFNKKIAQYCFYVIPRFKVDLDCSQSAMFSYFYSIVKRADRIARELDSAPASLAFPLECVNREAVNSLRLNLTMRQSWSITSRSTVHQCDPPKTPNLLATPPVPRSLPLSLTSTVRPVHSRYISLLWGEKRPTL